MSNGLTADNLLLALPDVLRQDEHMQALAVGIAEVLAVRPTEIERLLLYPRIDELPEELLDRLAYDFKVDWWDADYTLAQKRQTLKDNWQVHRLLGTKAAVERAICAIYPETKVQEWFEYGGEPYHFKLDIDLTASGFDKEREQRVIERVAYYKNLRSHLDSIYYFAQADPVVFPNEEHFQPVSLLMPFYFSNLPNDIILLNGRRRLDGSWILDSAFRGVAMRSVGLAFRFSNIQNDAALLNGQRLLDGSWQLEQTVRGFEMCRVGFAGLKLNNHERSVWPVVQFSVSVANQNSGSAPSLAVDSCFAEHETMTNGSLTRDTMWRLGDSFKLDGSKKLNAAIITETL